MAGSVNKVILVGRLGRDPEARNTNSGGKIVNLAIATSETWNDKNTGERKERTEWHRVVIFNENTATAAERYLKKGRTVYIEGELRTRKWTDQQGVEKFSTEVVIDRFRGNLVFLDSGNQQGNGQTQQGGQQGGNGGGYNGGNQNGGYNGGNGGNRNGGGQSQQHYDPDYGDDADIPF